MSHESREPERPTLAELLGSLDGVLTACNGSANRILANLGAIPHGDSGGDVEKGDPVLLARAAALLEDAGQLNMALRLAESRLFGSPSDS